MNRDILERLLIDRASGELSEDIEAVLNAYLAKEPELAREADTTTEVLGLAKLALASPRELALPERKFARLRLVQAERRELYWRVPRWAFGMAACLIGGIALGTFLMRETVPSRLRETALIQAVPQAFNKSTFWSAAQLRSFNPGATMTVNNRLLWKSPVRKPEIKYPL